MVSDNLNCSLKNGWFSYFFELKLYRYPNIFTMYTVLFFNSDKTSPDFGFKKVKNFSFTAESKYLALNSTLPMSVELKKPFQTMVDFYKTPLVHEDMTIQAKVFQKPMNGRSIIYKQDGVGNIISLTDDDIKEVRENSISLVTSISGNYNGETFHLL